MRLSREMVFVPRLVLDEALHLENRLILANNPDKVVVVNASGAENPAGEWIGFHTEHAPVEEMKLYYGRHFFLGITPTLGTSAHAAFIVKRDFFKNPDDLKQKIRRETGVDC